MKKLYLLLPFSMMLSLFTLYSQTMQVQSNSGDKTYNISDVQSITFGKMPGDTVEMVEIPAGSFQMGQAGIAEPVHYVALGSFLRSVTVCLNDSIKLRCEPSRI